jgi:two-component sensor histidine kinase
MTIGYTGRMIVKQFMDRIPHDLSKGCLEHAPLPMATVEGATHIMRDVNPAFCRLTGKSRHELVGEPIGSVVADQCLEPLDCVFRSGRSQTYTEREPTDLSPVPRSYTMWPVMAGGQTAAVMIQVTEATLPDETMRAMNEALVLGSLRQHELTEIAERANIQLRLEVAHREQAEQDARTLTNEVSHRIKNNLQIVVGLIAHEARQPTGPSIQGYGAIEARIGAIAELYALISQSGEGRMVPVDTYLRQIARTMSASLLGEASGIEIDVEAEPLEIDPHRAVPLGLLVNELVTNAVKHAFPDGTGRIILRLRQIGGQIELDVGDDGVGMKDASSAKTPQKHGADYVAIFVRQLGGTHAMSRSQAAGTVVTIAFPLLAAA